MRAVRMDGWLLRVISNALQRLKWGSAHIARAHSAFTMQLPVMVFNRGLQPRNERNMLVLLNALSNAANAATGLPCRYACERRKRLSAER